MPVSNFQTLIKSCSSEPEMIQVQFMNLLFNRCLCGWMGKSVGILIGGVGVVSSIHSGGNFIFADFETPWCQFCTKMPDLCYLGKARMMWLSLKVDDINECFFRKLLKLVQRTIFGNPWYFNIFETYIYNVSPQRETFYSYHWYSVEMLVSNVESSLIIKVQKCVSFLDIHN